MEKPKVKVKFNRTKQVGARVTNKIYYDLEDIKIKLGLSVSDVLEYGVKFIQYEMNKNNKIK